MKAKKLGMGIAAATLAAMGGLGPTAMETAQTIAEVNQTTVQQAQGQRAQANQGQQNAVSQQKTAQSGIQQNYLPYSDYGYMNDCGMSPKEYGLYLLRSGKNKYNDRRRKHWAKMRA